MTYTQEQLEQAYQRLPEASKEILYSVETSDKLMAIGQQHQLHIDQIGEMADEVGFVLLGLAPSSELLTKLQTRLKVERVVAENLTADINTKIFLPIRDSLRQLTEKQSEMPSQADILHDIENPPAAPTPIITPTPIAPPVVAPEVSVPVPPLATPAPSVLEQKMSGAFSLPKENPTPTEFVDPYREALK